MIVRGGNREITPAFFRKKERRRKGRKKRMRGARKMTRGVILFTGMASRRAIYDGSSLISLAPATMRPLRATRSTIEIRAEGEREDAHVTGRRLLVGADDAVGVGIDNEC